MSRKAVKKRTKRIIRILLGLAVIAVHAVAFCYLHVADIGEKSVVGAEDAAGDCAIVLGAYVDKNGNVSQILRDRLDVALALYKSGQVGKILVTGDHGRKDYSEVWGMKDYLTGKGVPEEDIFMDHAGFNTYDSMFRAKAVFMVKNPVIVTQRFHLLRALYIADRLDMDAAGVESDLRTYRDSLYLTVREMGARAKAVFQAGILKPAPKYLGAAIPISGSGLLTEDREK